MKTEDTARYKVNKEAKVIGKHGQVGLRLKSRINPEVSAIRVTPLEEEATDVCFGRGGAYVEPNEEVRCGESENPAVQFSINLECGNGTAVTSG